MMKQRCRKIIFYFFLLLSASGARAQIPELKPMKDSVTFAKGLELFSKNTSTIQGEFIQEKKLKMLNDKVISKGHLYYKKENKLRWEYNEPFSYVIAMNSGKVMMMDDGRVTSYDAAANRLFMELNDLLMTCINGNIFQSKKFTFRLLESEKNNVAEMIPLQASMKSFIDRIILYFDKTDYTVTRVEMLEPGGNSTVIVFRNIKLNADIPEKNFILN